MARRSAQPASTAPERAREADGSPVAVLGALVANAAIAGTKLVGFLFTGAASLLAESIHSLADTSNQGVLFWGRFRSRRRASTSHPFGYGREQYFWAFVVAVVLFTGGGLFALFEAEEKLRRPHELTSVWWAIGVLLVALVFEASSLTVAVRRALPGKGDDGWLRFIRRSKRADLPVVLLEDSAAIVGVLLALTGVVMADLTGNARFDAVGSLGIGLLLVTVALVLAFEMKSLLIGERASQEDVEALRAALEGQPTVGRVVELRTEQLGPTELLVGVRLVLREDVGEAEIAPALAAVERSLRAAVDSDAVIYVEPVQAAQERTSKR